MLSTETESNFERLLPLAGGNNFRDLGGYKTRDNRVVSPGKIFRSGVMTSLTKADQQQLNQMEFGAIVDFRSKEELELFPNHWAKSSGLNFVAHDYSMLKITAKMLDQHGNKLPIDALYENFPVILKPLLKLLFQQLLDGNAPLVFNCSAGQDRTGVAAALILHILDVPWATIIEDYHLSTQYRRPEIEHAGVDLESQADTNEFAKLMLRYTENGKKPQPLFTDQNQALLEITFNRINDDFGSIFGFLDKEIGVSSDEIKQLKEQYLT